MDFTEPVMKKKTSLYPLMHGSGVAVVLGCALLADTLAAASVPVIPSPAPAPVQGPPDGMIPPTSSPSRDPSPSPAPAPSPAPTPSPSPALLPPAQPLEHSPAATSLTARPETANRSAEGGTVRPAETTADAVEPVGPETATPDAVSAEAMPAASESAVPVEPSEPGHSGDPEWLPLAALAAIFAVIGGGLWVWRRRRRTQPVDTAQDGQAIEAVESSVPPPVVPPPAREENPAPSAPNSVVPAPALVAEAHTAPAASRAPTGRRADLVMQFETLNAQTTLINFRLRYKLTLHNEGDAAAMPVKIRVGLFAGTNANPQGVAQWYVQPVDNEYQLVERIRPGETMEFEAELAAPLDALNPLVIDGRSMAIPLVAIDARYHHGPGEAPLDGQTARAFVVGRETGLAGAKLAPFRLDQGPTSFAPLGQRDTGISKTE